MKRGIIGHRTKEQTTEVCGVDFHNESLFGLTRCDPELLGKKKSEWIPPTQSDKKQNHDHISAFRLKYDKDHEHLK